MNGKPVHKQGKRSDAKHATSVTSQLDSSSTAESILNKALKTSANKMGFRDVKQFIDCIKEGDPVACSYCHYNIAKELGEVLGSWDKNIKYIYAYGYDDNTSAEECAENVSPFSLVHMIIWAERKTKALTAMIETLDRAITQHQCKLLCLNDLKHMLDIQVIDDADVKNRTGYAALLKSIYQTPVQVWGGNNNP
ncbi:MAG: hypothetical protein EHM12_04945 [Dehalococcoidia bacterium]|nr:MAG: hypothetical protein EHM12_04945 [Dehalococcoidia bacterium]